MRLPRPPVFRRFTASDPLIGILLEALDEELVAALPCGCVWTRASDGSHREWCDPCEEHRAGGAPPPPWFCA